jgi:hypothetical protein
MTQADPWDETARMERQMEVELLSKLTRSGLRVSRAGARTEPAENFRTSPPEAEAGPPEA